MNLKKKRLKNEKKRNGMECKMWKITCRKI